MSNKFYSGFRIAGLCLLLCACGTTAIDQDPPVTPAIQVSAEQQHNNGAIFTSATDVSLFSDIKARRIGDIFTVFLVEQTSGQNSSDTSLSRSTAVNLSAPTFGGRTRDNMLIDLNSGRTFAGDSDSSQSNQLNGSIAVTVKEVLPGGNLVVEGEKWIQINQSREHISLRGIVRPKDIGADNTLYSTQVADAHISYAGQGVNRDANSLGWAARIVFSSIWPF